MGSSVLDKYHLNTCGYPSWAPDSSARDQHDPRIDECGNINDRTIHTLSILYDTHNIFVNKHDQQLTTTDYNQLKPYFRCVNADTIKKSFENTTQWAVSATRFPMRNHFKSRFPVFNISRRNEAVATDTIFSDRCAIDSGVTMAQIVFGKTLWSLMYAPCIPISSLSIFWRTTSDSGGPLTEFLPQRALSNPNPNG